MQGRRGAVSNYTEDIKVGSDFLCFFQNQLRTLLQPTQLDRVHQGDSTMGEMTTEWTTARQ